MPLRTLLTCFRSGEPQTTHVPIHTGCPAKQPQHEPKLDRLFRQWISRSVERVEGLQGFAEQFRTAHALCFGRPQPGKQSARMRCRIPHSIKVSSDLTTNQILTHAVEPSAYTLVCWPASSPRAEQLHYGELRLHNRGASRPERFPHR